MGSGITIVCREVDKNTGEIASYVCKRDVKDSDIHIASIRSRVNPELTYYAIRTCVVDDSEELEELGDLLSLLKRRRLTDDAIDRYGGIVKL